MYRLKRIVYKYLTVVIFMYVIKRLCEDFFVKELYSINSSKDGIFSWFILKKKNFSTFDAVKRIANFLRIPVKDVGFAGCKDKRAVTEQLCSIKNVSKSAVELFCCDGIGLEYVCQSDRPVSLGFHDGNFFRIVVRNIKILPEVKPRFINFFGEQRLSVDNAQIGKLLVQKKFKDAAVLLSREVEVQKYVEDLPSDAVGALRKIPVRILKFYVHAYQSFLWNKMVEQNSGVEMLPIIGFSTTESLVVKNVLKEENISCRDFIIKQLPDISSEGNERAVWAMARNLKVGYLENDELNDGMKKVVLEFELDKGCYATEFLRQSFAE